MNVEHFMSTHLVTASTSTSLPKVWDLIFKKHIHCIPVIDSNQKLVGIIAEEDLLAKLFPGTQDVEDILADDDDEIHERLKKLGKLTVADVMSKRVYFTRLDTNVMRALSRMIIRKVRQLPVLDDDDRLVGMISKGDVFDGFFKSKLSSARLRKKVGT